MKHNLISANRHFGLNIDNSATGITAQNNWVGLNLAGTGAVGNQFSGIFLQRGSTGNTIGPNNIVSANVLNGIVIDNTCSSNTITTNNVGTNGSGGGTDPTLCNGNPQIDDQDTSTLTGNTTGSACIPTPTPTPTPTETPVPGCCQIHGYCIEGAGTPTPTAPGNTVQCHIDGDCAAGQTCSTDAVGGAICLDNNDSLPSPVNSQADCQAVIDAVVPGGGHADFFNPAVSCAVPGNFTTECAPVPTATSTPTPTPTSGVTEGPTSPETTSPTATPSRTATLGPPAPTANIQVLTENCRKSARSMTCPGVHN